MFSILGINLLEQAMSKSRFFHWTNSLYFSNTLSMTLFLSSQSDFSLSRTWTGLKILFRQIAILRYNLPIRFSISNTLITIFAQNQRLLFILFNFQILFCCLWKEQRNAIIHNNCLLYLAVDGKVYRFSREV